MAATTQGRGAGRPERLPTLHRAHARDPVTGCPRLRSGVVVGLVATPYASCARDYRGVAEASEHGADISPMAHPRTHPGFPA